jgi:prevent-host-death family protein
MSEEHMGIRDLRDQLGKRVDAAHFLGEATVIEKNGEPRAVLVPYAEWAARQEGNSRRLAASRWRPGQILKTTEDAGA